MKFTAFVQLKLSFPSAVGAVQAFVLSRVTSSLSNLLIKVKAHTAPATDIKCFSNMAAMFLTDVQWRSAPIGAWVAAEGLKDFLPSSICLHVQLEIFFKFGRSIQLGGKQNDVVVPLNSPATCNMHSQRLAENKTRLYFFMYIYQ